MNDDIKDYIAKARKAQQQNPQQHPVQLEISQEEVLWASDEERMEHFRETTIPYGSFYCPVNVFKREE